MTFRRENNRFVKQAGMSPKVFSDPIITAELRSDAARHPGNVAAFLLAVNLLSRMFERVQVVFPSGTEVSNHPWRLGTVHAVVEELNDTVEGSLNIGAPRHSDVVLSIGERPSIPADHEVVARGSPWRAALDCVLPDEGDGVFGFLYAACIGAAQVLLHILNGVNASYHPMEPFKFSILDLYKSGAGAQMPKTLVIPETHLVGVGAVGSAAIYALSHLNDLHGVFHLIDNESVDESNLNRYVLMRRCNIGSWKVDVACEVLGHTTIQPVPFRDSFSNYVDGYGDSIDLLLSPIDTREGRRGLAKTLPRRVINAATGGTTVTVSTHGFNDGKACLHCLYPPPVNQPSREEIMATDMGLSPDLCRELMRTNTPVGAALVAQIEKHRGVKPGKWEDKAGSPLDSFYVKAVCGEATLHLPAADMVTPLSFISASAGILLAAELVKVAHPNLTKWTLDNYFRVDTFKHPNPAFRRLVPQNQSGKCICRDHDYTEVYAEKYG